MTIPTVSAAQRMATAQSDASAALEKLRPSLAETCWAPSAAKTPEPRSAVYTLDVTFDANGAEASRGVSEDRSAFRADVGDCLRRQPLSMRIRPPGATVRLTLSLTLPGG